VTEQELLKAKINMLIEAEGRSRGRGDFVIALLWSNERKKLEKKLEEVANAKTRHY